MKEIKKKRKHFYEIESTHFSFTNGQEEKRAIVVCRNCGKVKIVKIK